MNDDNINVTKRDYMNPTDNNLSLLNDIYLIVSSTNFKRTPQLLEFLDGQIAIEEDSSFDIDDLHDPEFNMRNYLNG